MDVQEFLQALVQGTATGIVIAIILGIYGVIRKSVRRREQVSYIRNLVSGGISRIRSVKDEPEIISIPKANIEISVHAIRATYYQEMRGDVESALTHRSTELTYDRKKQIRKGFFIIDFALEKGKEKEKVPDMNIYECGFKELEGIEWLKL